MASLTSKSAFIPKLACLNCTGPVPKPKRNNVKKKKFCCDNCRKEFHKNNGISVHRLKEQVKQWVRDELKVLGVGY